MTAPWKKPAPKASSSTKLTPASVAWARRRAKAAGRRYPNLVDNMAAARRQREGAAEDAADASGKRRDGP
ncbi:MAG TPA: hypothetical protein VGE76_07955 [Opitutaceae bacterium]